MAVGSFEPAEAITLTMEAGMSWTPAVLIVRNMHIAFVATPGVLLSLLRSSIAFIPSGVAALFSPRALAAMFMSMLPMAGWSRGTPGKSQRMTGAISFATSWIKPESSAIFMIPSQSESSAS